MYGRPLRGLDHMSRTSVLSFIVFPTDIQCQVLSVLDDHSCPLQGCPSSLGSSVLLTSWVANCRFNPS